MPYQMGLPCKWINDRQSFLLEHFDTIQNSPSQIYHSASHEMKFGIDVLYTRVLEEVVPEDIEMWVNQPYTCLSNVLNNGEIRELEEDKQKTLDGVKELHWEPEEQIKRAKEADGLSKKCMAEMIQSMEVMNREAKELRQALEQQRERAQEADGLRKCIADMQSKFEEEKNQSGESPEYSSLFHLLTWQPFNRSSPRPIFT